MSDVQSASQPKLSTGVERLCRHLIKATNVLNEVLSDALKTEQPEIYRELFDIVGLLGDLFRTVWQEDKDDYIETHRDWYDDGQFITSPDGCRIPKLGKGTFIAPREPPPCCG